MWGWRAFKSPLSINPPLGRSAAHLVLGVGHGGTVGGVAVDARVVAVRHRDGVAGVADLRWYRGMGKGSQIAAVGFYTALTLSGGIPAGYLAT